jgi:hypothetical protein
MIDEEHKLIRGYGVTDASVHDSVPYLDIMPVEPAYPDQEAFGDSASPIASFLVSDFFE